MYKYIIVFEMFPARSAAEEQGSTWVMVKGMEKNKEMKKREARQRHILTLA